MIITKGLHEIHITVDPRDLFGLRMYCLDNKIKPILAVSEYGECPIQAMISKFKNGTGDEVIVKAHEMAKEMTEYWGIRVTRIKIESMMHNEGVPTEENAECTDENYFEFHLKVEVTDKSEWNQLAVVCREKGAHLSFNAFKKETIPLITLRIPGSCGMKKAVDSKDVLMDHIKIKGFFSNSAIQSEFSIYDTNIALDNGWLY